MTNSQIDFKSLLNFEDFFLENFIHVRTDFFLDKISYLHIGKYRGGCSRILHNFPYNFLHNTFLYVGASSWQIEILICESQEQKNIFS